MKYRYDRLASAGKNFLKDRITSILVLLIIISLLVPAFLHVPASSKDISRLEKRTGERLEKLDAIAEKMLDTENGMPENVSVPEDMVIYRYENDSLTGWINEFPLLHDETYSDYDGDARCGCGWNRNGSQLNGIGRRFEYRNIGPSWYLVKSYRKDNTNIIGGLLIQTDRKAVMSGAQSSGSATETSVSKINGNLRAGKQISIIPLSQNEGYRTVFYEGYPVFSAIDNVWAIAFRDITFVRWITAFLVVAALMTYHYRKRNRSSLAITVAGTILCRIVLMFLSMAHQPETKILSPVLYADNYFFSSLGSMLISHICIFIIATAIFMMRKRILHRMGNWSQTKKNAYLAVSVLLTLLYMAYIHLTMTSISSNSKIVLELFRITEIDIYTALIYGAYSMLFLGLLFMIHITAILSGRRKMHAMGIRFTIAYILAAALYISVNVSWQSMKQEKERSRIWTNRLAVERDLGLEIQLNITEYRMHADNILKALVSENDNQEQILVYLSEKYFFDILDNYDFYVTICRSNDYIKLDRYSSPVNCMQHFNEKLARSGIPLHQNTNVFYINDMNGKVDYALIIPYMTRNRELITLFIQIESKHVTEIMDYSGMVSEITPYSGLKIKSNYSYAKYFRNRLSYYRGRYNYPVIEENAPDGFNKIIKDGHVHFMNRISDDQLVVLSRPQRSIMQYLLSYSYTALFLGLVFYIFHNFRSGRKKRKLFRHSFRKKITILMTSFLILAMVILGAGTIVFTLSQFREMNFSKMENEINDIQTSLQRICRYMKNTTDLYSKSVLDLLSEKYAGSVTYINLYSPDGKLIETTHTDVFEDTFTGYRMNSDAFREITSDKSKMSVIMENNGIIDFYSLYAPVYNETGKLLAIVNIPFFKQSSSLADDSSYIVAATVNVYLLLMLLTLLSSFTLSKSISRPLAQISRKMKYMNISRNMEHIDYRKDDELGLLVQSYNKMVDDLEESTRQLAQKERESAWKEMARQIAHEIKNPLTPMKLSLQYLMRLKSQNAPRWEDKLDSVSVSLIEQIDILTDVASEFSNFAKFYSEDSTLVNLNTLLQEQKPLFNTGERIRLEIAEEVEDAFVMARKGQLARVFMNMISNAAQALEGYSIGHILITVRREGRNYTIDIEDNGPGVPEEYLDRLFKPNFTTKSSGTGLGLAICRSIIEQSQGTVSYRKSRLGGADFRIELPVAEHTPVNHDQ